MAVRITLVAKCSEHPGYTGVREAKGVCAGCEDIYYLRHPDIWYECQVTIEKAEKE